MGSRVGSRIYLIERRGYVAGTETWNRVQASGSLGDALKLARRNATEEGGSFRVAQYDFTRIAATVHGGGFRR